MTKATLALAEEALAFARGKFLLKSNNKAYEDGRDDARLRQADKAMAEYNSRFVLGEDADSLKEWKKYVKAIIAAKAGNCHAMATVAMFYLMKKNIAPLTLVGIADPGDHNFLALGDFNLGKKGTIDKALTIPVEKWPDSVFICDPWANIACKARLYSTTWKFKMAFWKEKGKRIVSDISSPTPTFIKPTKEEWFMAIVNHGRVADFYWNEGDAEHYAREVADVKLGA